MVTTTGQFDLFTSIVVWIIDECLFVGKWCWWLRNSLYLKIYYLISQSVQNNFNSCALQPTNLNEPFQSWTKIVMTNTVVVASTDTDAVGTFTYLKCTLFIADLSRLSPPMQHKSGERRHQPWTWKSSAHAEHQLNVVGYTRRIMQRRRRSPFIPHVCGSRLVGAAVLFFAERCPSSEEKTGRSGKLDRISVVYCIKILSVSSEL